MKKLSASSHGGGLGLCGQRSQIRIDEVPLANAAETVAGISQRHPDNRGLQNASARIRETYRASAGEAENHPPGQQKKAAGGTAGSKEPGGRRTYASVPSVRACRTS